MTCIVGLVHQGTVYIGGDSAGASSAWDLSVRKNRKVFRNGPYLFGCATRWPAIQALEFAFDGEGVAEYDDGPTGDAMRHMCTDFIGAARACFNATDVAPCEFLVGYRGRLFHVYDCFQVAESACGYDAAGCAANVALGVMYATRLQTIPRGRIALALEAAEAHSAGVRAPFHIEQLPAADSYQPATMGSAA